MAKKPRDMTSAASPHRRATRQVESVRPVAEQVEQPPHEVVEKIRPALKLSELRNNSVLAAYQKKLATQSQELARLVEKTQSSFKTSEPFKNSQLNEALSAHQKLLDQVRNSLHLPAVEQFAKQTREAAAVVSERLATLQLANLQNASDLARAAASLAPAQGERRPALPSPQIERLDVKQSTKTITSARDLGRLVREARQKRKLSQQAFADLVGVGRRFISELEHGKATLEFDKVLQVASATGLDVLARYR